MDLSIIIVNWNSKDYLKNCLKSIYAQKNSLSFETIVVDNASYDGSENLIKDKYPEVIFIQSKDNLGFARANNLGFESSSGRNLLFLNPDTEVYKETIEKLGYFLDSTPDAGAVGCRILNSDLTLQTSCIQAFPTILNQILDIEYLKLRLPGLKMWGIKPLFLNSGDPQEVEVISGACLMIKRRIFEQIKLFSIIYFMYSEDLDLCHKIREYGYKNYYLDEAKIIHHGGGSTARKQINYFSVVLMRESIFNFLKKSRGLSYAYIYKAALGLSAILRIPVIFLVSLPLILSKSNRTIAQPFLKWIKILRWSFGLEHWTKEPTKNR